jgi:hypothetical protein
MKKSSALSRLKSRMQGNVSRATTSGFTITHLKLKP